MLAFQGEERAGEQKVYIQGTAKEHLTFQIFFKKNISPEFVSLLILFPSVLVCFGIKHMIIT